MLPCNSPRQNTRLLARWRRSSSGMLVTETACCQRPRLPVPDSSTSLSPLLPGKQHLRIWSRRGGTSASPRPGPAKRFRWSSSAPTRPGPCTSATDGEPPSATPSAGCSTPQDGMLPGNSTTTMPDSRSPTWHYRCKPAAWVSNRMTRTGRPTATRVNTSRTWHVRTWPWKRWTPMTGMSPHRVTPPTRMPFANSP